jgi:hypothetical protein
MGMSEDERIRNKNKKYTKEGIMIDNGYIKFDNVSVHEVIDLLKNNGFKVELKDNQTLIIRK